MKLQANSVIHLTDVETLYGEQDLASASLFSGGYINFGYWENFNLKQLISKRSRSLSSRKLYSRVFASLSSNQEDQVVEVGCGLGNGCIMLAKKCNPKSVIGIDISSQQTQRAIKKHKIFLSKNKNVKFITASAENIPLPNESVTRVFSVEAMQHFFSISDFLQSSYRILKYGGKLIVTTFFFKSPPSEDFMKMFPNFANGVDKVILIDEFTKTLKTNGFKNIKMQSIGKYVWDGFDKWISQTEYKDTWDKNWIQAYRDGMIDYCIFEVEK